MLFADDISTFSVIHGPVASVKAKNKDLLKKGIDLFNEKMASILEQVQKRNFFWEDFNHESCTSYLRIYCQIMPIMHILKK